MTGLRILHAGPACSLQDAGRTGFLRYGVTPAGPMDWIAHQTANAMAGNPPGAAVIEVGPGGLIVTAAGAALRLGLSVQGFRLRRDGSDLPTRIALTLQPGVRLQIEPGLTHLWGYVAVAGGFDTPPVMGSLATHTRSGLGPFGGTTLATGQTLPALCPATDGDEFALFDGAPHAPEPAPIRYVPGPQDDFFTPAAFATLNSAPYSIAPRSDRMAYRLSGPPLDHAKGHDIVSDGIALGSIQVPGDGLPLVLMADRQPTGGYPKIGCVIRADLPRLAQTRPGQPIRFAPVPVADAVAALRAAIPDPQAIRARAKRLRSVHGLGPNAGQPMSNRPA